MTPLAVLVPMLHVASVPRSLEFYARLGFAAPYTNVPHGASEPSWAWLQSGGAKLMVTTAGEPVDPAAQAVIFYVYCTDVAAYRAELQEAGVEVSEICYPFYAPRGEFRVRDPDGYALMVTHT